nr:phage/plasmid primase, P4 family [Corynebacterium lactis]
MTNTAYMNLADRVDRGLVDQPDGWGVYPAPSQPMAVARHLIRDLYTTPDELPLLAYWRGDLWHYTGTHWRAPRDVIETRGALWEHLEKQAHPAGADGNLKPWSPTTSKVSDLMEPLKIQTLLDGDAEPPCMTTSGAPAGHVVAMTNGLFNIDTRKLQPHTPAVFATWSLPFDYDPDATAPRWQKFLREVFEHDPDGARLLQEFMGYLISGRADLQKALMIIGTSGAGKGVISTIMRALMGTVNTTALTMSGLAKDKDSALVGCIAKPLAVMEDARDTERAKPVALERLLSLIANDTMMLDPKYKDPWVGRLGTRLVLISNELPRFKDASGAILRRFAIIRLEKSFTANPDPDLADKLLAELPGIFVWALAGLDALNKQNGQFTQPAGARGLIDTMTDLTRPLDEFIDWAQDEGRFIITGTHTDYISAKDLNRVYRQWCDIEGRARMNTATLANELPAAYPQVQHLNTRLDDAGEYAPAAPKRRLYTGIKPLNIAADQWLVTGKAA